MAGKCGAEWGESGCVLKSAALRRVLPGKNVPYLCPSDGPHQEFKKIINLREYHNDSGTKFCLNLVRSMKV